MSSSFRQSVGIVFGSSIALAAMPALGAAPTVAPFAADEEGFVGATTSTVQVHSGTGGNPDGHIQIRKDLSPPVFDIGTRNSVTPDFIGDYGAGGITGGGFDLNVFNNAIDDVWLRFRDSVNDNGWHYPFGAVAVNASQWESFDAAIDPTWSDGAAAGAGWVQEAGAPSWATVMGDVFWIEVRVLRDDSTIVGIDNVRLAPTPGAAALGLIVAGVGVRRRRR